MSELPANRTKETSVHAAAHGCPAAADHDREVPEIDCSVR